MYTYNRSQVCTAISNTLRSFEGLFAILGLYFNWLIVRQICKSIRYNPCTRSATLPTCTQYTYDHWYFNMYSYNKLSWQGRGASLYLVGVKIGCGSNIQQCKCKYTSIDNCVFISIVCIILKCVMSTLLGNQKQTNSPTFNQVLNFKNLRKVGF